MISPSMLPLQSTSSKGGDLSDSENRSAKWWNKSMKEFSSLVTSSKLEKNKITDLVICKPYTWICTFCTVLEFANCKLHSWNPNNDYIVPSFCAISRTFHLLEIVQEHSTTHCMSKKICLLVWLSARCVVHYILYIANVPLWKHLC